MKPFTTGYGEASRDGSEIRSAKERLKKNKIRNSDKTINAEIAGARTLLAREVSGMRQKRDALRKKSASPLNRFKSALGFSETKKLSQTAARVSEQARERLKSVKRSIESAEIAHVRAVVRETVAQPLNELAYARQPNEIAHAQEKINVDNLLDALYSGEYSSTALENVLKYGTNETYAARNELVAQLLHRDLSHNSLWATSLKEGFAFAGFFNEAIFNLLDAKDRSEIIRNLENKRPDILEDSFYKGTCEFVNLCLAEGSKESLRIFKQLTNKLFTSDQPAWFATKFLGYRNLSFETGIVVRNALDEYLQKHFQLSFSDMEPQWQVGPGKTDLLYNLDAMFAVENAVPGGAARLYKKYGIREYGRYPIEMLVAQLNEEEIEQPYGVIIFPQDDHNSSFDQKAQILQKFFNDTRGHIGIKVFEVDGVYALSRRLIALDKQYGHKEKISFAIVGGHGNQSSLVFGNGRSKGSPEGREITKASLQGGGARRVNDFFVQNPQVILFSCSTGADNAIGQEISRVTGARVTAPKENASVRDLSVSFGKDEKPHLSVVYSVEKNTFSRGVVE